MRVFKFGGASVKDAEGVRNVERVLRIHGENPIVVVVSAMGKTTNALEQIVAAFFREENGWQEILEKIKDDHLSVMEALFPHREHLVYQEVAHVFTQIRLICSGRPDPDYNVNYDRIVSYGEIVSTRIISAYLNDQGWTNHWIDARKLIKTDANHRFARVNWTFTETLLQQTIKPNQNYVIQGFIGSDDNLHATTLGREGSDYTASIVAYAINADDVCIWKDVPGILNGDPKVFDNVTLIEQISYREAIELAYFGASVIHPKTIQPLQRKNIPLRVKSFLQPESQGTCIGQGVDLYPALPIFIRKTEQGIIKISTRDLAFIVEENLSAIYDIFHRLGVRVNLMQNSAVSSRFCINNDPVITPLVLKELERLFDVEFIPDVSLFTIRHYTEETRKTLIAGKVVRMEQVTPKVWQIAASNESALQSPFLPKSSLSIDF
ncbi:MAG: aspartate kinase [Cryomorphaceae bacterium]|nr:aspartate kinase [Cryomorphaceae bacterium]